MVRDGQAVDMVMMKPGRQDPPSSPLIVNGEILVFKHLISGTSDFLELFPQ
jgi:hypothetical protein